MDLDYGYPSTFQVKQNPLTRFVQSQLLTAPPLIIQESLTQEPLYMISGNWVADGHFNHGHTTNIMDQLWVVWDQPLFAQRMNITHVIVKLGCY